MRLKDDDNDDDDDGEYNWKTLATTKIYNLINLEIERKRKKYILSKKKQ